jgi:uncharacterized protein (DUF305 family)
MDHGSTDHAAVDHAAMDHGAMAADSRPDVVFMQGMIPHHAQALAMAALVPGRGAGREVTLIAERIRISQADEMARMARWLTRRGANVPAPDAHAGHLMPGMLTPDQMARLAAASGANFDRLFLEYMIQHHRGALVMVGDILDAPRGTEASEVYALVTDIEADQLAEIDRMQTLLTRF